MKTFVRMMRSHLTRLAVVVVALLSLIGVSAFAQDATPQASSPFDIPPEIAGHEAEWPLGNHDYANTRAAVGSTINASNVKTLEVAWAYDLKGTSEWGASAGCPVISDGVVYFQDLSANLYAVD